MEKWTTGEIITDKNYPYEQLRAAVDAECLRAIMSGKWIIATADGPTAKERDENAKLIASAPEMAEALTWIASYCKNMAVQYPQEATRWFQCELHATGLLDKIKEA